MKKKLMYFLEKFEKGKLMFKTACKPEIKKNTANINVCRVFLNY